MTAIYTHNSRKTKMVQVYHRFRVNTEKYTNWMHMVKVSGLVLGIIAFGLTYIIFVNKASTSGYFYKIETNQLDAVKFDYNLIKLEVMEAEQKLWNDVSLNITRQDPVQILTEVVTITHRDLAISTTP